MTPQRLLLGTGRHPLVIVDSATRDAPSVVEVAAALAPFPRGPNPNYPGVRRVIDERDTAAFGYVHALLESLAPFVAGGFDCDGFDLIEASFSIVTTPPSALAPAQRAPHFDSTDRRYLAVMHYLSDHAASGTAFFRQRASGIERVDKANVDRFVAVARAGQVGRSGYVAASDPDYERIGAVDAVRDRVVMYQGGLLHSGVIPADLPLDADPRVGRLTANLFIRTR